LLFVKLLVFILLLAVIDNVTQRIPGISERRGIGLIVSIAVSVLAVRYLTSEQLVNFIWLPYGVLGMAISVIIPFIIGFFFLEGFDSFLIRKIGWASFAVIFLGLAYMRWDTLSAGAEWYQNLGLMYLAIAVLSVLLIVFDKNIRAIMLESSLNRLTDRRKRMDAAEITDKIRELRERLARTDDSRVRKDIMDEISLQKKKLRDLLKS